MRGPCQLRVQSCVDGKNANRAVGSERPDHRITERAGPVDAAVDHRGGWIINDAADEVLGPDGLPRIAFHDGPRPEIVGEAEEDDLSCCKIVGCTITDGGGRPRRVGQASGATRQSQDEEADDRSHETTRSMVARALSSVKQTWFAPSSVSRRELS